MIKHLKPLSRDLTNLNMRDKSVSARRADVETAMMAIVSMYAKAVRFRFEVLALELLLELLERNTGIFRKPDEVVNEDPSAEDKKMDEMPVFEWVGMKNMSLDAQTPFYYRCL